MPSYNKKFQKSPYHTASLAKYKKKKNNDNRKKRKREKIIVTFDEDARKEYITGFHKRKVQRRIQAHEKLREQDRLQRIQDRAEKKEAEQERIVALKQSKRSKVTVYSNHSMDNNDNEEDKQIENYNDDFTKERFGRENVTVTTTFGFGNSSDEDDDDGYDDNVDMLKTRIKPFILRREKREVLSSLPEKTEIILKCPLTPEQEKLYESAA